MRYVWDEELNLYRYAQVEAFAYSDGAEVEQRLFNIIQGASDRSTFSPELVKGITDWPSEYHLSRSRHCLIRPLGIKPGDKVLELGCGCGVITRYLGEIGANVVAVEGSIARARNAAERCRDLSNIRVFVDDLLRFETDERFDWILLIGVLEYAPVFTDEKEPAQHYLRTVARFLTPDGKLVIAIENKLGLKYFNGCSEDHLGVPFYSIQNLYGAKTPRTFGRRELLEQLSAAGFLHCCFYYPFPDYKLPSVVLSEDALMDPQFNAVDLIIRSHARDYLGSPYRLFDDALVFSTLSTNGLFAEFSNSFLVVATLTNDISYNPDKLAMTFAVNRIPEFSVVTSFYRSDDIIHVVKKSVFPDFPKNYQFQDCFSISNIFSESIYHLGRQMLWRLLYVRANKGTLDQVIDELRPWVIYLLQFAAIDSSLEPSVIGPDELYSLMHWFVPGTYLDCTPFNLIESTKGLIFIDNEWQADSNVPLGWVITRGVLHSLSVGLVPGNTIKSVVDVVQGLCMSVGLSVTKAEVEGWLELEGRFQSFVTGLPNIKISLSKTTSGLVSFNQALVERDGQITGFNQAMAERDTQITGLNQTLAERDGQIASLNQAMAERDAQVTGLNQTLAERDGQVASLKQEVIERDWQSANFKAQLAAIYASRSWRITAPVRAVGSKLRQVKECGRVAKTISHFALNNGPRAGYRLFRERYSILSSSAFDCDYYRSQYPDVAAAQIDPTLHYLLYGASEGRNPSPLFDTCWYMQHYPDVAKAGINPLFHYLRFGMKEGRLLHKAENLLESSPLTSKPLNQQHWGLLATPHVLFIANLIAKCLRAHGCQVTITTNPSDDFSLDCYIVICPQMFKLLPPAHKRIVFQVEQSISSRWFTEKYLQIMIESLAVLEYNLHNIEFLTKHGISYPHVFYLPIGAILNFSGALPTTEKKFDILFYGDYKSSPRRQRMLDVLVKEFNVKIITEEFAPAIWDIIRQAKVVINLHYYENALLEVPRIMECLSLGVPVLSETAWDQHNYPELAQAVRFFEQGSVPAMLQSLKEILKNPIPHSQITSTVQQSARRFEFMFDRFLVGMDFIPNQQIKEMPLPTLTYQVVLSLPEIIHRRQAIQSENLQGFTFFDGIRKIPGWVGCALSYRALAFKALEMGFKRLTVLEDDVLLPDDFQEKMNVIYEYLDEREGQWDIFSGLIADLHSQVKILNVEDFKNIRFVTINKMTSTVCNIYNRRALEILTLWNFENKNVECNTIDRYLESRNDLRVVVTLPFLVGHREDVNSTIWGFQNTQYHDMIAKSQQKLQTIVWKYNEYKYQK